LSYLSPLLIPDKAASEIAAIIISSRARGNFGRSVIITR
jgi:hypothetical protein